MITGARKKAGKVQGEESKEEVGIVQLPRYNLIKFVMEWYLLVFVI